jgi:phosphatidylglycerol:prolipoprotein diacylglycerol transferase
MALLHPQFNPVALQLGPVAIHWYGLMYLLGFVAFMTLGKRRLSTPMGNGWTEKQLDDLLFFGVLGVILGGRLGEVLFYQPAYYREHLSEVFAIWQGGMSFHGGFLGVLLAMILFAHRYHKPWLSVMDFIAPLVPLGLGAGRVGNFINGELWGRVARADLPWAMIFPHVDALPRHPSQLYQAVLEGGVLFALLWWFSATPRPQGRVSALFLIGYGTARIVAEFFRNPDAGIFGQSFVVSMGQWLSLPMLLAGAWLWWRAR